MQDELLQQILSKLGEIQSDVNGIKTDITEIKTQFKAHRIETDDNFTKLYHSISDKETAIEVLNKRVFGTETKIAKLVKEKH
ncbi:hypothetical protein P4418_22415 [Bacillus thuringiensis]|uniref:hypothetical protein n=1 Tax=Bacillus thuringiensis TaxID=1428 RepID=UPI0018CF1547|nr:hypothetical protein [Bacillus thuringiensis]EKS8373725.1 hypothetical protein [Bacillus cereus]MBG9503486.1 peroxidase [Bacillus thuringiensis]MBG9507269.1 peroxidase [Bacillus thuringiensis]MBG9513836.1 peroxidase [Bacillus thuringiensis]MED3391521.1 hypothetical protein [Bacillus thuringiensis]